MSNGTKNVIQEILNKGKSLLSGRDETAYDTMHAVVKDVLSERRDEVEKAAQALMSGVNIALENQDFKEIFKLLSDKVSATIEDGQLHAHPSYMLKDLDASQDQRREQVEGSVMLALESIQIEIIRAQHGGIVPLTQDLIDIQQVDPKGHYQELLAGETDQKRLR
jgi:hypothetical protein